MDFVKRYVDFTPISLAVFAVVFSAVYAGIYYGLGGFTEDTKEEMGWKIYVYPLIGAILISIVSVLAYKRFKPSGKGILNDPYEKN